jgi:hypothetical protein
MLHPHLHSLVPDGLFVPGPDKGFEFVPLPPPTRDDIEALLRKIAQRLTRLVQSVADEEASFGARWEQTAAAMVEALARSLRAPAPADQLTFAEQDHEERTGGPDALRAKLAGFSLHAGRWVPPEDREAPRREAFRVKRSNHKKLTRRKNRIVERLAPRNWREQTSPMMRGGVRRLDVSDRVRATQVGGLGVVHQMVQELGLDRAINAACPLLKRHLPYQSRTTC